MEALEGFAYAPEGDTEHDSHSMVIVGYKDDPGAAGGGVFIVRNSWSTDWGRLGAYGGGYGTIPYGYVTNYCWEAFA